MNRGLAALLLASLLLAAPARAEPAGSYELVDVRRLAGVAGPASPTGPAPSATESPFAARLRFGQGCSVTALPEPPLNLADPMLSDLAWGLVPGAGRGWRVRCAGAPDLAVAEPDGRVLVAVTPDGTAAGLYEAPLSTGRIRRLQQVLRDRKFHHLPPSGELDDPTLAALGFYLDHLGLPYRFRRPVLSEALLRELGG